MLATPPSLHGVGMAEGTLCMPPGLAIATCVASFSGWKGEERYHRAQSFGKCHLLLSLLCFPGHWSQAAAQQGAFLLLFGSGL